MKSQKAGERGVGAGDGALRPLLQEFPIGIGVVIRRPARSYVDTIGVINQGSSLGNAPYPFRQKKESSLQRPNNVLSSSKYLDLR